MNRSLLAWAWPFAKPILQTLDPERAHDLTLAMIARLPLPAAPPDDPRLATGAFGLRFKNPVGLAAGFDKNGVIAHKGGALGFGFVEVGTLTPLPQAGNAKPRLFRLSENGGIINRFGFNNLGYAAAQQNLRPGGCILGVNVGANKDSVDRMADYIAGVQAFAESAHYLTINVSSPNTPNLRDLQKPEALAELLARALHARERAARHRPTPILLKIAPDLSLQELDGIVRVARDTLIDGMIVGNTTVSRPSSVAAHPLARETGGLSGRPLFDLSTRLLAETYLRVEGQFPIIGVGGIDSEKAAVAKMEAGADLVQIYAGLVFRGPALVAEIKRALVERIGAGQTLTAIVGAQASEWVRMPWPT